MTDEKFDVMLIDARDGDRRALVARIPSSWMSAASKVASFVDGEAMVFAKGVPKGRADGLKRELEAIGALVELRAAAEAPAATWGMIGSGSLSLDSLTSIGGDEPPPPKPKVGPPPLPPSVAPATSNAPPPPAPQQAFGVPRPAEPLELELPKPEPAPTPPPVESSSAPEAGDDDATKQDHSDDAPVEEEWKPVPGRLLNGELRKNAVVRLVIGAALGLLVGLFFAWPIMRRAEKKASELRAEAIAERNKVHSEALRLALKLDAEADAAQSGAAKKVVFVWLLVGGAVVGVWYRVT